MYVVCNRTIRSPRLRRHIILLHFIVYGYICMYVHTYITLTTRVTSVVNYVAGSGLFFSVVQHYFLWYDLEMDSGIRVWVVWVCVCVTIFFLLVIYNGFHWIERSWTTTPPRVKKKALDPAKLSLASMQTGGQVETRHKRLAEAIVCRLPTYLSCIKSSLSFSLLTFVFAVMNCNCTY